MEVLERTLDDLGEADFALRARLELEILAATRRDVRLQAQTEERVARLRALAEGEGGSFPTPCSARLLAALAFDAVLREPAATVGDFARRAIGDGQLLAVHGPESPALSLAVIALWMAEDLGGARALLDAAIEQAQRQGSVVGFVMLSCWRSHVAWRAGDLELAEADGAVALEVGRELGIPPAIAFATAALGDALLDRGDTDAAAALLDEPMIPPIPSGSDLDQPLLYFRGRLRVVPRAVTRRRSKTSSCAAPAWRPSVRRRPSSHGAARQQSPRWRPAIARRRRAWRRRRSTPLVPSVHRARSAPPFVPRRSSAMTTTCSAKRWMPWPAPPAGWSTPRR